MDDEEYRPRPNDDLVEPLFGGIHGADEVEPLDEPRRGVGSVLLVVVLVAASALAWWLST